MNRENYQKVVKMLGYDMIYHFTTGVCGEGASATRIDVDNSEGRATEVLERIVSYVDAMLYDADHWEPTDATDSFIFIVDGERHELDIDYMTHDSEDFDWEQWNALREEILHAKQVRVEYCFVADGDMAGNWDSRDMVALLKDLLADGRLADCVSLWTHTTCGGMYDESNGIGLLSRHCLLMNGLHNGRYVCGEVPFERDEALIRSCGGWRQSDEACDEDGVYLRLHPKTSSALLNRLRKAATEFSQKVDCNMELNLSYDDYRRKYLDKYSAWGHIYPSALDKETDDREQRSFPDLRVYFTAQERQQLLEYYPTLSRSYVQYADSSYTEDDLERIRFLWTLVLIGRLEGLEYMLRPLHRLRRPASQTFINVFNKLPEDIRIELYGIRDYDPTKDSMDYYNALFDARVNNKKFFDRHSGIGDISLVDDKVFCRMRNEGYFIHVNMIHLKDIDDVRLMCDFMNELKEIERLAQAETGEPLPRTDDEWINDYQRHEWESFFLKEEEMLWTGAQLEKAEELPRATIREYHEQASQKEPEDMNRLFVYEFDDLTFEADEESQWVRLRFRIEDNKWICEIAQADV